MLMRLKILFVVFVGILMLPGMAQAAELKVGFVDIGRLMAESPQATTARELLQEEFAPRQREVVALQTELQERQETIQRDLEVMGPEERRNAERDLRRDSRELERNVQEFQEDTNLRRNEAQQRVARELLIEVRDYATGQGYDLVVSSDSVLYASTTIDITEQVLAGLKARFTGQGAGN